jgi:Subtilase family
MAKELPQPRPRQFEKKIEPKKNQYIFELGTTGFKLPPPPSDMNKKNSIIGEGFPNRSNKHFYTEIKKCRCNPRLRLFDFAEFNVDAQLDFYEDGGSLYYIQLQDDFYYNIIGAMPNIIHGSPDNEDPPPQKPGNSTDYWQNYELDEYVPLRKDFLVAARNHADTHPNAPVVAIMDTGIDLRYFYDENDRVNFPLHYYNNHPCDLCPNLCYVCDCDCNKGIYGCNFIRNQPHCTFPENPFDDDLRHKHGTRIAKIIANVTDNNVRIMPLKTANFKGESEFFDIFCAFEYIKNYNDRSYDKDKVKFINASWGYYGKKYALFTHYMKKLDFDKENPPIKFITAAGNAGDLNHSTQRTFAEALISLIPNFQGLQLQLPQNIIDFLNGFIGRNRRDERIEITDSRDKRRYPLMYSEEYNGVYSATTIQENNGVLQAVENYSREYVEIGVIGTRRENIDGTFLDPLSDVRTDFIKGSSYATAYLTAYLVNGIEDYKHLSLVERGNAIILVQQTGQIICNDVNSGVIDTTTIGTDTFISRTNFYVTEPYE